MASWSIKGWFSSCSCELLLLAPQPPFPTAGARSQDWRARSNSGSSNGLHLESLGSQVFTQAVHEYSEIVPSVISCTYIKLFTDNEIQFNPCKCQHTPQYYRCLQISRTFRPFLSVSPRPSSILVLLMLLFHLLMLLLFLSLLSYTLLHPCFSFFKLWLPCHVPLKIHLGCSTHHDAGLHVLPHGHLRDRVHGSR